MTRVRAAFHRVHTRLWFIPAVITAFAGGLAVVAVRLDERIQRSGTELDMLWFVYEAGAEGARGVLGTIAGSLITVTGVVFSITIVVLQLASSQFRPRVLRTFTEDRPNQIVLGVFIGTFTYSLMVLRTVRSAADDYTRFVPSIAVTLALGLALLCVGCLIFYVGHIARSIQVEVILQRVTRDALRAVDRLFPDEIGTGGVAEETFALPSEEPAVIRSPAGGYLQAIDDDAVMHVAAENDLLLRMESEIGAFVLEGQALASVWPRARAAEFAEELTNAFNLGPERTPEQDVERGLIELADIGIRALSPGVNDPTTAIVCIDRLSEVLAALGRRRFPREVRYGPDGRARVVAPATSFARTVSLGFGQLRHHGTRDPAVTIRLLDALGRVTRHIHPARRSDVTDEIHETLLSARREIRSDRDLARIEAAALSALA